MFRRRRHQQLVQGIHALAETIDSEARTLSTLPDHKLRHKTTELRKRHANAHESLDELLIDAFAVVAEASNRVLSRSISTSQLAAACAIHIGGGVELTCEEDEPDLVCVAVAYLRALSGAGVHVIAVDEQPSTDDFARMTALYSFLGLEARDIHEGMNTSSRQLAYASDVTYGPLTEFCSDYMVNMLSTPVPYPPIRQRLDFAVLNQLSAGRVERFILGGSLISHSGYCATVASDTMAASAAVAWLDVADYLRCYSNLGGVAAFEAKGFHLLPYVCEQPIEIGRT